MSICFNRKGAFAGALASFFALHASVASATRINVDFNSGGSPTQSGAGLIGSAGDIWNGIDGSPSASGIALVDSANAPTPVTLSFVSSGAFDDSNNSFNATSFADLMRDYAYASSGTTGTLSLSGLSANTAYNLVLYSNPNQGRVRSTEFIVNGVSRTANSVGTADTFTEGVNYVNFPSAFSDGSGNLLVSYQFAAGAGILEGDVNGFQLETAPPPKPSGLINVDFNSNGSPTQSGAALIGAAGDFWNGVDGSPGASNIALIDSAHAPTSVTLSFTSSGAFDDSNNSFGATPVADLMRDYAYASNGSTGTVSLSGLVADGFYDLILYSNPNQDRVRSTEFIVNGVSKTANSVGTADAFTEGVNYVEFAKAQADGSGNLVIDYQFAAGAGILEGDLNGIQIRAVTVPEPSSFTMIALVGAAVTARRRRRQQ